MVELKKGKTARIRLRRVPDASGPSLKEAIKEAVEVGSIVQTDGWGGYNGLSELGYTHEIIRENAAVGENLLPEVNRCTSLPQGREKLVNLTKGNRVVDKVFHIQNVNAYHSRLKAWMRHFKGVATRYLPISHILNVSASGYYAWMKRPLSKWA